MFEKLLALLPSNPGMSHQLAFYARRMREEASIRRTGMVFIVMAFLVQFFAVLSPPQPTAAYSNNDMINGGVASKSDIVSTCKANTKNYEDVLNGFGITCQDIADGSVVSLNSASHNRNLYSLGWISYCKKDSQDRCHNPDTGILNDQRPYNLPKVSETIYARLLDSYDTGSNVANGSTYPSVVKGTATMPGNTAGTTFFILFSCGNLVFIGPPAQNVPPKQVTPTPVLKIQKQMLAGFPAADSKVAPGTTLGYQVDITNTGTGPANKVALTDIVPANTTFSAMSQNPGASGTTYSSATNTAKWTWDSVPSNDDKTVNLKVKVNANTPNGTKICNTAQVVADNAGQVSSNKVCITVVTSPPPPVITPPPTCQNGGIPSTSPTCAQPCTPTANSDTNNACVILHKTAVYGTTSGPNADGTTAQPGSIITYTLSAQNQGKIAVDPFVFTENLSDVMDYAVPTNLDNGSLDANGNVTWPGVNLAPGEILTRQITVQVKNPVPSTPVDPGDPNHFDLIMTNVYGDSINIKVPTPVTAVIQQTASNLPNTGPGTSLFVIAIIMVLGGYFYSRSRLLTEESTIAVQEAANA